MRIGKVIGNVTLCVADPKLKGGRMILVQPDDPATLRGGRLGRGETVVCYDGVGARFGDLVGFSEGREAAMPFHPDPVAIDAYLACILESVTHDI